jgi:hypothetical protein
MRAYYLPVKAATTRRGRNDPSRPVKARHAPNAISPIREILSSDALL